MVVHRRVRPHAADQPEPGDIPGRQHWPHCYSAILAGGGIRGGAVYGESDKIGAYVKDRPVRPQDLGATIYHALGVPYESKRDEGRAVEAAEHRDADRWTCSGDGWRAVLLEALDRI